MLVGELAEDRAVPDAFRTDARADRVEPGLARGDRNLRPQTRLARDRADLDRPGLDLRHLSLHQAMDEGARGA